MQSYNRFSRSNVKLVMPYGLAGTNVTKEPVACISIVDKSSTITFCVFQSSAAHTADAHITRYELRSANGNRSSWAINTFANTPLIRLNYNSVDTVTSLQYGQFRNQGSIPEICKWYLLLQSIQKAHGSQTVFDSISSSGFFQGNKAAGISILRRG